MCNSAKNYSFSQIPDLMEKLQRELKQIEDNETLSTTTASASTHSIDTTTSIKESANRPSVEKEYHELKRDLKDCLEKHRTPFFRSVTLLFAALLESSHASLSSSADGSPYPTVMDVQVAEDDDALPLEYKALYRFSTICSQRQATAKVVGLSKTDTKKRSATHLRLRQIKALLMKTQKRNLHTIEEYVASQPLNDVSLARRSKASLVEARLRMSCFEPSVAGDWPVSAILGHGRCQALLKTTDNAVRKLRDNDGVYDRALRQITTQTAKAEEIATELARKLDATIVTLKSPAEKANYVMAAWKILLWNRPVCPSPSPHPASSSPPSSQYTPKVSPTLPT
jgi:hypothetical protein